MGRMSVSVDFDCEWKQIPFPGRRTKYNWYDVTFVLFEWSFLDMSKLSESDFEGEPYETLGTKLFDMPLWTFSVSAGFLGFKMFIEVKRRRQK